MPTEKLRSTYPSQYVLPASLCLSLSRSMSRSVPLSASLCYIYIVRGRYSQALSNTEHSSATKSALKKGRVSQKKLRRGSVDQLVSGLIGALRLARARARACVRACFAPMLMCTVVSSCFSRCFCILSRAALSLADNKRPIPANPAGNASDPLRSQSPSPTSTSMTGGGASGLGSADIEAVLDKLTMMEKRQESVHAENHHRMLGLTAQYDSLGERLAAIERMLESIVTTADS